MTRVVGFAVSVVAAATLLSACAMPFVASQSSGARAKPTGAFGQEAQTAWNTFGDALARLPDGRVLAAGGSSTQGPVRNVELYDPQRNAWMASADLPTARAESTATSLPDGSVLVAGGMSATGEVLGTALRFQPDGTWTPTGPMSEPRYGQIAMPTANGRVLLIGGWPAQPSFGVITLPSRAIDVFDASTGRFTPAPQAPAVVQGAIFASLRDGSVLMAGGDDPAHGSTSRAWLLDPGLHGWRPIRPMPEARAYGIAVTLADGGVLVAGGEETLPQPSATQGGPIQPSPIPPMTGAVIYDPTSNAWTKIAEAPPGIQQVFGGAMLLGDGRALTFNLGFSGGPTAELSAIFYDPATRQWSSGSPVLVTPLNGSLSPIILGSGKVLLVLGSKSLIFDPEAIEPLRPEPPVHPLASPQLTPWLVVLAALLLLILAAQYGWTHLRGRNSLSSDLSATR